VEERIIKRIEVILWLYDEEQMRFLVDELSCDDKEAKLQME